MNNLEAQSSQEFNFPFKPYEIQLNFMKSLYSVLENSKIGIFEVSNLLTSFPRVLSQNYPIIRSEFFMSLLIKVLIFSHRQARANHYL